MAGLIHAGIEPGLDQLDETGGHDVIVIHGLRIVTNVGGITHDHKQITHPHGIGRQQIALYPQQTTAARRKVQNGFDPHLLLHQVSSGPGAHAHPGQGAISHINVGRTRLAQHPGPGNEPLAVNAAGWAHFDGNDETAVAQILLQTGRLIGRGRNPLFASNSRHLWQRACRGLGLIHCLPRRGNVGRRRATAAPNQRSASR